jgi:hypothetical protein
MSNISDLFRTVKKLSSKIYNNKLDRIYYWNEIKKIIPNLPYCNMSWKTEIVFNDGKHSSCSTDIYEYVCKTFNIKPNDDEMIVNYISDEKLKEECSFFFLELINVQRQNDCTLLRICQIAYNLGQYQALYSNYSLTEYFTAEINNYYTKNQLNNFNSYVYIDNCDDENFTELIIKINNLIPDQNETYYNKYLKYKKKYLLSKK